ncbi:hypothetical protein A9Q99_08790 [Gammaproteobacteria bacterium 45_16_T64]|nr:hypothetical protein A9Q99_08790 [Gammaproteobacteria bacterium 45_16_T64]
MIKEPPLKLFGLNDAWIDLGVVTAARLDELAEEYYKERYPHNLEHHALFVSYEYINNAGSFDNDKVLQVAELLISELDGGDVWQVIRTLLSSDKLTDDQFTLIASLESLKVFELAKYIEQVRLLRCLRHSVLTDDVIKECIDSGNPNVQRQLVERADIEDGYLTYLKDRGVNKKIRNIAGHRLRTR